MTSFFFSPESELDNSPFFKSKPNGLISPPESQIRFRGYLFKQGKILKLWNKRYYLVSGTKLYYKKVLLFIFFYLEN